MPTTDIGDDQVAIPNTKPCRGEGEETSSGALLRDGDQGASTCPDAFCVREAAPTQTASVPFPGEVEWSGPGHSQEAS